MMNLSLVYKISPYPAIAIGACGISILYGGLILNWVVLMLSFTMLFCFIKMIQMILDFQVRQNNLQTSLDQINKDATEHLKRLEYISKICYHAANGDLNHRIVAIDSAAPTAGLEKSVNKMLDLVEAYCKESFAATRAASKRQFFRKIIPTGLRGDFKGYAETINHTIDLMSKKDGDSLHFAEQNVQKLVHSVTLAAEQLNEYAKQVSSNARIASEQVVTAAAGVEQSSVNVQAVADTAERMAVRSEEISRKAADSRDIAEDAKIKAQQTNQTVSQLADAAQQITQVIEMIEMIAGQTNLLALNATIEAARAGEAGKGFAVVAEEVKNLSTRTRNATDDVRKKVGEIQSVAKQSVEAIISICDTLIHIGEHSNVIAEGVGEQDESIRQISQNLNEAAQGARLIASAVEHTKSATNKTSEGSQAIAKISDNLNAQANSLLSQVGIFINQIKQADEPIAVLAAE